MVEIIDVTDRKPPSLVVDYNKMLDELVDEISSTLKLPYVARVVHDDNIKFLDENSVPTDKLIIVKNTLFGRIYGKLNPKQLATFHPDDNYESPIEELSIALYDSDYKDLIKEKATAYAEKHSFERVRFY